MKCSVPAKVRLGAEMSSVLVKVARNFDADVCIEKNGGQADCKMLFELLLLHIIPGDILVITAKGYDACEALEDITEFLNSSFLRIVGFPSRQTTHVYLTKSYRDKRLIV
ncbi:HPr family phosphocarrier protein [Verrucomicrobiota bacterium]